MNSGTVVIVMVVVWVMVNDTHGDVKCPHPDYVAKHVCPRCTDKEAKEKAIESNKLRKKNRQTCASHVFKASKESNAYYVQDDFCILRRPVKAWYCHNLRKDGGKNAMCNLQIACLPRHSMSQKGHLISSGARCGPIPYWERWQYRPLILAAPQNSEECKKTCHGATATSRGVCRVGSAVAAGLACLATGWFTLGFSCAGAIGAAGVFSEGCAQVTNFADEGCDDLCTSMLKYIPVNNNTDYNTLLNDHICVLDETSHNYQWLKAVEFQGDVVKRQKNILDNLDGKKSATLEKQLRGFMQSDILNDLKEIRQLYDTITYSTEGLLVINSESDDFKRGSLQYNKLQHIITSLYRHLSGRDLPSIYQQHADRFCNMNTFDLMNSYLAEGHLMLSIAMELANTRGYMLDVTEYLDNHLKEYTKRCGCPSGQSLHVVHANIDPLIEGLKGVADIFAGPDLIMAMSQFARENIDRSNDADIVMKALAGTILAHPRNQNAVMEKLESIKYGISTNSFKVCFKGLGKCVTQSHCINFRNKCWCKTKVGQSGAEACDYEKGYAGEYYSIVSSGASRELIRALGLTLPPDECLSDERCNGDCATNYCYVTSKWFAGCHGTSLTCWDDKERWARKGPAQRGIVRCRNFEH